MRYETQVVQVGEHLGPIDWSFDFAQFDWSERSGGVNPEVSADGIQRLRDLEAGMARGERWQVMSHQCYREVISVGMYDGWPFWKPVPSILTMTPLGAEWMPWYNAQAIERIGPAKSVDAVDPVSRVTTG